MMSRKGQWFILMSVVFIILFSSLMYMYNTFYDSDNDSFKYSSLKLVDNFFDEFNENVNESEFWVFVENYMDFMRYVADDKGFEFKGWVVCGRYVNDKIYVDSVSFMDDVGFNLSVNGDNRVFDLDNRDRNSFNVSGLNNNMVVWNVSFNNRNFYGNESLNPDSFVIYYFLFNGSVESYVYQGFEGSVLE